jgi:hypothetical protein
MFGGSWFTFARSLVSSSGITQRTPAVDFVMKVQLNYKGTFHPHSISGTERFLNL